MGLHTVTRRPHRPGEGQKASAEDLAQRTYFGRGYCIPGPEARCPHSVGYKHSNSNSLIVAYKRRREEAENGVVLHGGLYGPPYELLVGQNGGHGFSGKVISKLYIRSRFRS